MTKIVYVMIAYDFWADTPHADGDRDITDIGVGVFRTLEGAKHAVEERYAKDQEEHEIYDEDQSKIEWFDHADGGASTLEAAWPCGIHNEVLIRKMTMGD